MDISTDHRSLWLATAEQRRYDPLDGDTGADVLVVGGGMTGLQTAYLLKLGGARVVLIEARRIGGGASGHTTAKITALHGLTYDELTHTLGQEYADVYASANRDAVAAITELIEREAIQCDLRRDDSYTYAMDDGERARVEREVEAASRAGLEAEFVEDPPVPYRTRGAVRLPGQACFHPVRYLQALAALVDGDRCRVHETTRALDLDEDTGTVETTGGRVSAGHVVVATQFPVFDRSLLSMRIMPRRAYVLAARTATAPEGMTISAAEDYHSLRRHSDGGATYAILSGAPHRTGEGGDERDRYLMLGQWAAQHFAGAPVDHSWSTQDIFTNDDVPLIGHYREDHERLWAATGFKGWGMSHSMVAARIISDGILGEDDPWAGLYDPWGRSLLSGAGRFLSQAASSVKNFAVERVEHPDHPTCTHMGCTLQWNQAERSWDCPCHGSRYDETGEVLTGPAISALEEAGAGGA